MERGQVSCLPVLMISLSDGIGFHSTFTCSVSYTIPGEAHLEN